MHTIFRSMLAVAFFAAIHPTLAQTNCVIRSGVECSARQKVERSMDQWKRGDGAVSITIPTRIVDSGLDARVQWRTLEFDNAGCLLRISEEREMLLSVNTAEEDHTEPPRKQYVGRTDAANWFIDTTGKISMQPTVLPPDIKTVVSGEKFAAWTNSFINGSNRK